MAEIHVKNLAEDADEASLKEYFMQFGDVVNVDMKCTNGNRYSFIKFSSTDSATSAVDFSPHELFETTMIVEMASGRTRKGGKGKGNDLMNMMWNDGRSRTWHEPDSRKIFIGSLCPETTESDLNDHFVQFGDIVSVDFKAKPSGECKGYSFVTFKSVDSAVVALEGPNNIRDRDVVVDSCGPNGKPQKPDNRVVFTGGLPIDITEEELTQYFEAFGPVDSVDLKKNRSTGAPKGFAFVTFVDESTQGAVLAQEVHLIREKNIDVKEAQKGVGKWGPPGKGSQGGQGGGKGGKGKGGGGKDGNQMNMMKMMMMMKMMQGMNGGGGGGMNRGDNGNNRWTPY